LRAASTQPARDGGDAAARTQRIRRLLAVLEDVGHYSASHASPRMLASAWDRVGELLLASGDPVLTANATEVARHEVGTTRWWLAVRKLTRAIDDGRLGLRGGGWQDRRHAGELRDELGAENAQSYSCR
jgi:hypothetical protein